MSPNDCSQQLLDHLPPIYIRNASSPLTEHAVNGRGWGLDVEEGTESIVGTNQIVVNESWRLTGTHGLHEALTLTDTYIFPLVAISHQVRLCKRPICGFTAQCLTLRPLESRAGRSGEPSLPIHLQPGILTAPIS